jgi:hypothetical protein
LWLRVGRVRLLALLGLQLLASCISPYGPAILVDAITHVADPRYRALVGEWAAWHAGDPPWLMLAPLLQSAALLGCMRALWRSGPAGRGLFAVAAMLALASFRSIRFVAEYLLLSAPVIAVGAAPRLAALDACKLRAAFAGALLCLALVVPWGALRLPPYAGIGHGADLSHMPAASAEWLERYLPHARLLATFEDSWFLIFAVPGARVVVDGRAPFYGPLHIQRVQRAFADPNALVTLLDDLRVDAVVVRHVLKEHRSMLQTLQQNALWVLVGLEDHYALFVRATVTLADGTRPHVLGLTPGYETAWLLGADEATARRTLAELGRLPRHHNTQGYRAWVQALLALRSQLRAGPGDGLRPPANAVERALLAQALALVVRAAQRADGVPTVHAYHALIATQICHLDEAQAALEVARQPGESRETLLTAQEIALRRGKTQEVQRFLTSARALPGAEHDAWLGALRRGVQTPPACP